MDSIPAPAGNSLGQTPQVFDRCAACHAKEGVGDLGPNLHGVVGRKAGSLEDFRYSRAMARSGIVWNEKTLDESLKAPDQLVPATRPALRRLRDDAEPAAAIQYLKTLKEGDGIEVAHRVQALPACEKKECKPADKWPFLFRTV